jgi:hypothetical protein
MNDRNNLPSNRLPRLEPKSRCLPWQRVDLQQRDSQPATHRILARILIGPTSSRLSHTSDPC